MLAARLGPLGHRPRFGGFLYPGKPVWLPLNEKMVGPFPPPIEFFDEGPGPGLFIHSANFSIVPDSKLSPCAYGRV